MHDLTEGGANEVLCNGLLFGGDCDVPNWIAVCPECDGRLHAENQEFKMSLDVSLYKTKPTEVFWANITHNLNTMASAAGIYRHLWRPDEIGITRASQLIEPLEQGLAKMKSDPDKYREYDSPNGWGKYDNFVPWIERYIEACKEDPDAEVRVSR